MTDTSPSSEFNEQRYARSSYTLESPAEKQRINRAISLLRKYEHSRVLDVGCGDGLISGEIKRELGSYVAGMDASITAINAAAKICDEVYHIEFGTSAFPVPDNSFDAIFAGEVIEHLFYTEVFLEELLRITKPGGTLILSTPNLASWYNRLFIALGLHPLFTDTGTRVSSSGNWLVKPNMPAGHIRNFTLSSLVHLLKNCGWTIEEKYGIPLLGNRWKGIDQFISSRIPALAADLLIVCKAPINK